MPTITITQVDKTSAGVLRQPKNVFLMGPGGTASLGALTPDSNHVYYFTSAVDFDNTIGKCEPLEYKYTNEDTSTTYKCKSYGNQMAAELLTLGYNVYYYNINPKSTEPVTVADETAGSTTDTNGSTDNITDIETPTESSTPEDLASLIAEVDE